MLLLYCWVQILIWKEVRAIFNKIKRNSKKVLIVFILLNFNSCKTAMNILTVKYLEKYTLKVSKSIEEINKKLLHNKGIIDENENMIEELKIKLSILEEIYEKN